MSTLALLGLAALVVALWLAARARRYGRVFAAEHWRQVAESMVRVKAAALAKVIRADGDEPSTPDDHRILATSAGLAIVYTVSESAGRFVHHCSVSLVGGPTTHAVGGSFTLYLAKLLGLPLARLRCSVADTTVHHAELSLDADEHAALATAPVLDVSSDDIAALRREALDARARVEWQRMAVLAMQDGR